jgi:hypothetical protein
MAVVSCVEIPRERQQSGKFGETYKYQRGWMVRVDDVATPLPDITNANGVAFLDPHPDDTSCLAYEFQTKPDGNSLLHYTVSVTYYAPPLDSSEGDGGKQPEFLPGIPTVWTATSSVGSTSLRADVNGKIIQNSAGVPFPKLEADQACFRLALKRPWADYTWQGVAMQYTNAINSDTWMGQPPGCWKCQGMSAAPETSNEAGVTRSYWMTNWEFEYRAPVKDNYAFTHPGWALVLLDEGYQGRVNSAGLPYPAGTFGTIRDSKGQPIKEPAGLYEGNVRVPPASPNVLAFNIYRSLPFTTIFG